MTYDLLPATCYLLPTTYLKPPLRPEKREQVSIQSFGLGTKAEGRKSACLSICAPGPAADSRSNPRIAVGRGFQTKQACRQRVANVAATRCHANNGVTQALSERYESVTPKAIAGVLRAVTCAGGSGFTSSTRVSCPLQQHKQDAAPS